MAGSNIESADFDAFYGSDFGVQAEFGGDLIDGLYNREELQTDKISGVFPTFRCATRIDEGSIVTIDEIQYEVEDVLDLEFGEFLHALSLSNDT